MADDFIIAVFPSRVLLTKALDHLMELREFDIHHAAIVAKAQSGEVIILDDDIGPDEGGIAGGTFGAVMGALGLAQLGALALPGIGPLITLGAGALVGGVIGQITGRIAAHLIDSSLRSEQVAALTDRLEAGHPALVLEVKNPQSALPRLRDTLASFRAELVERVRPT